jgi:hypothetical protein
MTMTDADCCADDFDALLSSYCDSRLSADELALLNRLLRSDLALRRRYLHYMGVHASLNYLIARDVPVCPDTESESRAFDPTVGTRHGRARERIGPSRHARSAGLAACVALLVGATCGYLVSRPRGSLPRDLLKTGPTVARISKDAGARFDGRTRSVKVNCDLEAGTYSLVEGIVQVAFNHGAEVIITAPAEFDLHSPERLTLKRGKLSARVPEEARGFTVETPTATLVDLGTEFAADVDRDGNGEVHVFRGEVIVKPRSLTDARPVRLIQAQATRIDSASATPSGIEVDSTRFLRQLDEPKTTYSQLVTKLGPEVYLRMEPTTDGRSLVDSGSPGGLGRLALSASYETPWVPGFLGSAVRLRGPSFGDHATVPLTSKRRRNTLSVVAWVFAESRPRWATIVKRWGFVGDRCFHFGLSGDDGDLEVHIAGPDGNEPVAREGRPLPTGCWHHVAFVVDETALRLYRNGVELAKTGHAGLNQGNIEVLSVGAKLTGMGDRPDPIEPGYWHGRLDEISVFPRALSPYQIRQLYLSAERPESDGQP